MVKFGVCESASGDETVRSDDEVRRDAIHKASFGYRLSSAEAGALLKAYMLASFKVNGLEEKLTRLKAELESERQMNAILTQELDR